MIAKLFLSENGRYLTRALEWGPELRVMEGGGGRNCPTGNSAPMKARITKFLGRFSGQRSLRRAILVNLGQYLQSQRIQISKIVNFVENTCLRFLMQKTNYYN